MGYREALRNEGHGQLDRVVLLKRYSVRAAGDGVALIRTLVWMRETWAKRSDDEEALVARENGDGLRLEISPSYVVRYRDDISLGDAATIYTITEPIHGDRGGREFDISSIAPVGRRRFLEIAT